MGSSLGGSVGLWELLSVGGRGSGEGPRITTHYRVELILWVRPREISTVLAESQLPSIFLTRLVSTLVKSRVLKGTIESGYYIPEVYVIERQNSIVEELRRDGLIGTLHPCGDLLDFIC